MLVVVVVGVVEQARCVTFRNLLTRGSGGGWLTSAMQSA